MIVALIITPFATPLTYLIPNIDSFSRFTNLTVYIVTITDLLTADLHLDRA